MPRVKRAVHARKKRAKVLEQAKGYYGRKKSSYRFAKEQLDHSLVYAYRDRKNRKRTLRSLWIIRINAAAPAPDPRRKQIGSGDPERWLWSEAREQSGSQAARNAT